MHKAISGRTAGLDPNNRRRAGWPRLLGAARRPEGVPVPANYLNNAYYYYGPFCCPGFLKLQPRYRRRQPDFIGVEGIFLAGYRQFRADGGWLHAVSWEKVTPERVLPLSPGRAHHTGITPPRKISLIFFGVARGFHQSDSAPCAHNKIFDVKSHPVLLSP